MTYRELLRLQFLIKDFAEDSGYPKIATFSNLQKMSDGELAELTLKVSVHPELWNAAYDNHIQMIGAIKALIKTRRRSVSHSEIQSYKSCPRKHAFAYDMRIRSKDTNGHFVIGTWVHSAIEKFVGGLDQEAVESWLYEESRTEYADKIEKEDPAADKVLIYHAIAVVCFRTYVKVLAPVYEKNGFKFGQSEKFMSGDIIAPSGNRSSKFQMIGFLDGILIGPDNKSWIHEIKTRGASFGDSDRKLLKLDPQVSAYVWLGKQNGIDVTGVLYTILKKPTVTHHKITGYKVPMPSGEVCTVRLKSEANSIAKEAAVAKELIEPFERYESVDEVVDRILAIDDFESYAYSEMVFRSAGKIDSFQKTLYRDALACSKNSLEVASDRVSRDCVGCDYFSLCLEFENMDTVKALIGLNFTTEEERAFKDRYD